MAGEKSQVEVREFTINNDPGYIFTELVRANYDMVCFSCYIWNIEQIKVLARDFREACPSVKILVGGPEVSFCGPEFMKENPWADYAICGEGEYSFYRLCQVLESIDKRFDTVPGLIYRQDGKIYVNGLVEPQSTVTRASGNFSAARRAISGAMSTPVTLCTSRAR